MDELIVSVDFGGTHVRAALANGDGDILRQAKKHTPAEGAPESVVERIIEAIRTVIGSTSLSGVKGIGVGAPGPLNPWTGVVYETPNIPGFVDVHLKDLLEEEFGRPTYVGNDANLGALGEYQFGAGRDVEDLIYMTVSTGIGGGIVTAGQLVLGADGVGGEVGHIVVEADGPPCGCGNTGCLEALAAGPAIAEHALRRVQNGNESQISALVGGDLTQVTAEVVHEAAREGDAVALEVIRRASTYIGVGIVSLVHVFNPHLVLIGGGVSNMGDLLFKPIRETVWDRAMAPMLDHLEVRPTSLGDNVGLLGAVALVLSAEDASHS